jgi:hypothetical protein
MVIRVILATILGAIIYYAWGYLFWMLLPLGKTAVEEEPFGGAGLVTQMSKVLPTTGVYFIPFPATETSTDDEKVEIEKRHREGPLVRIFYTAGGGHLPASSTMLIRGFLHNLAVAFLLAVVLAVAASALPTFTQRLGLVFLVSVLTAVWLGLNEAVWFYHPWKYELYQAAYALIGGLLMGIVMAAIIKSKRVPAAAAAVE